MTADRKKKLRKQTEKQSEHDARKRAILDRLSKVMGLKSVFDRLPSEMIEKRRKQSWAALTEYGSCMFLAWSFGKSLM